MSVDRHDSKPHDRLRRAKSEISHNRISTETLKTEFRNRFFNRLRSSRSKSVDRFRQIVEDYGNTVEYRCINDIRKVLLTDKEGYNLLQTEEVTQLLNLIEEELQLVHLHNEGEDYIQSIENETKDVVNRLLNNCCMCGAANEVDNICSNCTADLTAQFE